MYMLRTEQKRQAVRRRKVTLNLDVEPYETVQALIKQVPGVSVSDIVSDMLRMLSDRFIPVVQQMAEAGPRERLQMLERLYGDLSGQQALEFARTYESLGKGVSEKTLEE